MFQFVSHAHCQQLLTSIWFEGIPGRQERGSNVNSLVYVLLILSWPILALFYIFFPKSRIGQIVRAPFMKFLFFSTSFGIFLCLLTMATFDEYRFHKGPTRGPYPSRAEERGPAPTVVESLIIIWVFGEHTIHKGNLLYPQKYHKRR